MLRMTLYGGFSLAGADGSQVQLKSQKAKALLAYLALSPGQTASREQIMALLWSDRAEAQARASLRQVLFGLKKELDGEVLAALRICDDAVSLDPDLVVVEERKDDSELLAGFHLHDPAFEDWLRDERLKAEDAMPTGGQPDTSRLSDKPSIAILPFTNMSGDPEQEYFSDGITEDIITELSRFESLFVIARNSSFAFKGETMDASEFGDSLGVQFIVQGSVRKAGDRLRISVQLIDAETGNHLWVDRYDRSIEDIFAVQDEVAS